ncbi:MAG TPA: Crp/Fnr family transcriptional regulator [Solirubrobacteraceae bacterium]|nr:Crp/Fnr family transcriptional regulator [Solirubrobacteraceae bacterium]
MEPFGSAVREAWDESFMSEFPPALRRQLLQGARVHEIPAGEIFYRGAHHDELAALSLVVEGLVRVLMKAPSGRQVTVRYAGPGAVVGIPSLILAGTGAADERRTNEWEMLGGASRDAEAIRTTTVLGLRPARFRHAVQQDPAASWTLARHMVGQLAEAQQQLAAELFLPVRSRVATHLLNLAEREGNAFTVRARHEAIAAAMGSVREVVSREIKRMEREGLLQRVGGTSGHMELLDPAALHEISVPSGKVRRTRAPVAAV